MSKPNMTPVVTVKLDACCLQTLDDIKFVTETGRILSAVLVIAPFALLFGLKGKPSLNSSISFVRRDFDLWANAISSANKISKLKCKQLCQLHSLRHRGGPANKFWMEMAKTFS